MWHEIFAGVYFCGLTIFCVLRELIFAIWTDWLFLLGINSVLRFSESTQYQALVTFPFLRAIEKHILKQHYGVQKYFIVYRLVSERMRQVAI